jgi:hypothetical protein
LGELAAKQTYAHFKRRCPCVQNLTFQIPEGSITSRFPTHRFVRTDAFFLLSNYVASASARSRRILLTPYYRTRRKHVAKARTGHPNLLTRIPKI